MFAYSYRPVNSAEPWITRALKPYSTLGRARAAGCTWANAMAKEGCPVEIKVFELVSDGRNGMVEKV